MKTVASPTPQTLNGVAQLEKAHAHWHGFQNIRFLIVFGDSYSDVGYRYRSDNGIHPSEGLPLGIDFPGVTWAEPETPNWVGYLVTEFTSGHVLLAFDYAVGGHNAGGVVSQVQNQFIPDIGTKPDWAKWSSDDSLFVTWIGINDLAFIREREGITQSLNKLLNQQAQLYDLGARNFLFIDVPPIHRSPAVGKARLKAVAEAHALWNELLRHNVAEFASTRPDATLFVYSANELFSRILDNPTKYGFKEMDSRQRGGGIWMDHIHPRTRVHQEIARDLAAFLEAQPARGVAVPFRTEAM